MEPPPEFQLTLALTPDFSYIINHSGSRIVCAHADYLEAVDSVRADLPKVEHFVALEGRKEGWLDYEAILSAESPGVERPTIAERDLLSINYTSGTTARPKGVMITHRNAYMSAVGTLVHSATRQGWSKGSDDAVTS